MTTITGSAAREECYALCHIFGIKFKVARDWTEGGWTHSLYSVSEDGLLVRQETVNGFDVKIWRASIQRLLRARGSIGKRRSAWSTRGRAK